MQRAGNQKDECGISTVSYTHLDVYKRQEQIIHSVKQVIEKYGLKKKDKEAYLKLREQYNEKEKTALNLFVLQIYAFQNMIRYNNSQKMNTPVGNNEYCEGIEERIKNFAVRAPAYELKCGPYHSINYKDFPKDTIFSVSYTHLDVYKRQSYFLL